MPETERITSYRIQKLAAIIFIGGVIILFLTGFDTIKSKVRDIKRRADITALVKALDLYHDEYGKYPDSINDWQGWDLSINLNGSQADFLSRLETAGLLDRRVKDPVNNIPFHYRYQKYAAGDFGCRGAFYILQAVNFELPTTNNGSGRCPEFNWVESVPNGYTAQAFD